jgi:hypothetical protein
VELHHHRRQPTAPGVNNNLVIHARALIVRSRGLAAAWGEHI